MEKRTRTRFTLRLGNGSFNREMARVRRLPGLHGVHQDKGPSRREHRDGPCESPLRGGGAG